MTGPALPDALLDLPFDQFTRHRLGAVLGDAVRRSLGVSTLQVLDVGGYPCLTPRFLPTDQVWVTDILEVPGAEPGSYIRADGADLPFRTGAFDLVVSLDSLEHVPPPRRQAYVDELLRVSRGYVLLAAPFATEAVALAERVLSEFIRVVNQEVQPQLQEHREYGWPDLDEWRSHVTKLGWHEVTFASGYVYAWLPLMLLKHLVMSIPEAGDLNRAIDRFYNVSLQALEGRTPAYRHGMVISKLGATAVLSEMESALTPTGEADRLEVIERLGQLGLLIKAAELHVASRHDDRLREELKDKERHILNLESLVREGATAREALAVAEARAAALETQVASLEEHLRALQQGKVMRTLRAIDVIRGHGR